MSRVTGAQILAVVVENQKTTNELLARLIASSTPATPAPAKAATPAPKVTARPAAPVRAKATPAPRRVANPDARLTNALNALVDSTTRFADAHTWDCATHGRKCRGGVAPSMNGRVFALVSQVFATAQKRGCLKGTWDAGKRSAAAVIDGVSVAAHFDAAPENPRARRLFVTATRL